ncbi:MAG: AAA family ATPase, partial [Planctomycetales bacterium]
MYESHFGFTDRPFLAESCTNRYFPGESIEAARQSLTRCIERAEGCGLVIGQIGTGKTLLCEVLAEHFQNSLSVVILRGVPMATSKDLLQSILYELGLPYRRLQEGELRLSLIDYLTPNEDCPHGMLLLVDEAHHLSPRLFEELRTLTNLVRGGTSRVRLVLTGDPVIEERFAHPKLASFSQRLVARCYLESLTASETIQYIRAQTATAGVDPDKLWTENALRAIHRSSNGCPRLINQLCDHTLVLAVSNTSTIINEAAVEAAWAALQQLPVTTNDILSTTENFAGDD